MTFFPAARTEKFARREFVYMKCERRVLVALLLNISSPPGVMISVLCIISGNIFCQLASITRLRAECLLQWLAVLLLN